MSYIQNISHTIVVPSLHSLTTRLSAPPPSRQTTSTAHAGKATMEWERSRDTSKTRLYRLRQIHMILVPFSRPKAHICRGYTVFINVVSRAHPSPSRPDEQTECPAHRPYCVAANRPLRLTPPYDRPIHR